MSGENPRWDYWLALYLDRYCVAAGLRSTSIAAYRATLRRFRAHAESRRPGDGPERVTAVDVLEFVEHLRRDRHNGPAAVNRTVTVLKRFYGAVVAMGHLAPRDNPLAHFPKLKAPPRRIPDVLSPEQVGRLLSQPRIDTILGMRDGAVLHLLYATGIRVSECSGLNDKDVDIENRRIRVLGKGGHERVVPLNVRVAQLLAQFRMARGPCSADGAFFSSREKRRLSRGAIYDRVRLHARKAGLTIRVSPHRLRHTCATHLVRAGVDLVTIRDLLGHRLITSTQIYIHMTAHDLRQAAEAHPIKDLAASIQDLLPGRKIPYQWPAGSRKFG